ncbi:hypothetical protein [Shimia sp.]|uniref:hypothetical protein n=1 Tax=Shimia sp. TaxID=1954381 RepID=UPI003B8B577E
MSYDFDIVSYSHNDPSAIDRLKNHLISRPSIRRSSHPSQFELDTGNDELMLIEIVEQHKDIGDFDEQDPRTVGWASVNFFSHQRALLQSRPGVGRTAEIRSLFPL